MAFALQNIPGASEGATTTTAAPSPSSGGSAPAPDPGLLGNPLVMLLIFAPFFIIMLWSNRSAQKRQQKAIAELKKGDTVLTQAGIRGKLVELGDRYAKIEIAPGTKVEILKTAVLGRDTAEAAAQIEKK